MAKIKDMATEDIRLHLILGGIQGGRLRDKLFSEKGLTMKRLLEITNLYEEAKIKKNTNAQHKAKKSSGQGDKKQEGTGCFNCNELGHLKRNCPKLPKCSRNFHKESECYSKHREEPRS